MSDNDNEKYYNRLGWYSPMELTRIAIEIGNIDTGLGTVLSDLAVVRQANNSELELEFQQYIHQFLRKNIPGFDDLAKRSKSQWN